MGEVGSRFRVVEPGIFLTGCTHPVKIIYLEWIGWSPVSDHWLLSAMGYLLPKVHC